MEKGRSRLPVTADAYGPTNSGVRRSLASRPPYRTPASGELSAVRNTTPGGLGGCAPISGLSSAWFKSFGARVTLFLMYGRAVLATKDVRAKASGQVAEGFTPPSVTRV